MKSRKIYKSGKSQVLAVPNDWYEQIKGKVGVDENIDVLVRRYDDLLLILPLLEQAQKQERIIVDVKDHEVMACNLRSYYMFGKDRLLLKVSAADNQVDTELKKIQGDLFGMTYVRESKNEISVDFNTPKATITELLDREFKLYDEMRKNVEAEFETFPRISDKKQIEKMEILEKDVDKTSYQARRSLVRALYEPTELLDLGLKHFADVLGYYRIETNLERIADLQNQIFVEITNLKNSHNVFPTDLDLNSFLNFYKHACDLISRSYHEDDSNQIASVIRSKTTPSGRNEIKTAYSEHKELVKELTNETIPKLLTKKNIQNLSQKEITSYGNIIQSLYHLESRIDGMVGNASNIAESWFFKHARY